MQKIYYLSTCDTCRKILKEFDVPSEFILQDIKEEPVTEKQLLEMRKLSGNYENLLNKRAKLYKERDLKNKDLGEEDYKKLLLDHYTFLKRPVIFNKGQIFIGNSKATVAAAKKSVNG